MSAATVEPSPVVVVVDRDVGAGSLLVQYLAARGWQAELVSDPRRVVRDWFHARRRPMIVLRLEGDDPGAFELLGALAAHAVEAKIVVCARRELDLRAVRVDRALPVRCRFSAIASALDELKEGYVVDAAE